jgi:hypothetical protein
MQLSHLFVGVISFVGLVVASPTPINDASLDALTTLPFDVKPQEGRDGHTAASRYPPGYVGLGSESGCEWTANALDSCQVVRHLYHRVRKLFQAQGTVCTQPPYTKCIQY